MTIRAKTILIICLTLVGVIVASYFSFSFILLRGFSKLEIMETKRNVERVFRAIGDNLSNLNSKTGDWATWDDAYDFMGKGHLEFIKTNLTDQILSEVRLNLVLFVDSSGRIVYAKAFDLENKKETGVPERFRSRIPREDAIIGHQNEKSSLTGLISLPEGHMLVASRPIVTSQGEGPIRGTLIMGRYLDSVEIRKLSERTQLALRIEGVAEKTGPGELHLPHGESIWVQPLDENHISGCRMLEDIYEKPALCLKVDQPRTVYRQGKDTIRYVIASFLGIGLFFGLMTLLFLERWILSPVFQLGRTMSEIRRQGDPAKRIQVTGKDELSRLGASINETLDALENSQTALRRVNDELEIRVEERTADLGKSNRALQYEMTERRLAEEALRESEERFRLLLKNANDAVYVHEVTPDGTGKFFDVNDQACQMLGYSREEMLRMGIPDIDVPEQREKIPAIVRSLYDTGCSLFETEHMTRDGYRVPVEVSARTLMLRGKPTVISVVRDITERKRAEAEREKLEAQFRQAQKMEAVGHLAGGVAHDFNNMLSIINGYSEMVLDVLEPSDPLHGNIQKIQYAGQRSANLVRQLLAFARKQTIAPEILDLNQTVSGMLNMLQRLIGENIDLLWKPHAKLWPVKMDRAQIDQILANLVVNARDAISGVGKMTIETGKVELDTSYCQDHAGFAPGEYVLLAVSDDGCGMDKEILANIFDPFFTTKDTGQGTGLGLSTVYGIVKQNEGFINVYSEPGQGTTFKIYLPRFQSQSVERPVEIAEPLQGGTETVLIVEDEEGVLKLGKTILEGLGFTVLDASSPAGAIRLASEYSGEIDLLITDVVMPEMNGRELAERLTSIHPLMKCLYMSGYTADVIAHRGVLAQGVHFIQKPFSKKALALKVREVLEQECRICGNGYVP